MSWHKIMAALLPFTMVGCGVWLEAPLALGPARSPGKALGRGHTELAQFYPVNSGAQWAYRLTQHQGDLAPRESVMHVAIAEVNPSPQGGVEARLERLFGNLRAPSTRVSIDGEAVRLARWVEADPMASLSLLRAPLSLGQSWPGRPFSGSNRELVVVGDWEKLDLPAGQFHARKLRHELHYADGVVEDLAYWYAPGVGVVKMIERARLILGDREIKVRSEGVLLGATGLPVGTVGQAPAPWKPGPPTAPGQVGQGGLMLDWNGKH